MEGWIKLHRCIEEWKWINDSNTLRLWLYCLNHARHEDGSWNGVELKAGQLVIGRKAFKRETGISEQSYKTALRRLKDDRTITTKSTNKYTIVTVENWDFYQRGGEKTTNKSTSISTSNQPATNQQLTTNKNVKNDNNERRSSPPLPPKGGMTDGDDMIDELIAYARERAGITEIRESEPTLPKYMKSFLNFASPELIKHCISIVGSGQTGGITSLKRLLYAIDESSDYRLKEREKTALRTYLTKNNLYLPNMKGYGKKDLEEFC